MPAHDSVAAGAEGAQALPVEQVPPVLAVALSRPLIGHLHHLAHWATAGDFETLVIWGELTYRSLAHLLDDPADPQALTRALARLSREPGSARPVHLHHLVQASGIPRETVRRKLERLAEQGRARRIQGGWLICPHPMTDTDGRP